MANYFRGGGNVGSVVPQGFLASVNAANQNMMRGVEQFAQGINKGLDQRYKNREEREQLEQIVEGEYGSQIENVDGLGQPNPEAIDFLSKHGEDVRDTSEMTLGQLRGLAQTMQKDRAEMQKNKEFALQERLVDLKETQQTSDIALAKNADTRAEKQHTVDVTYTAGMLNVAEAKNNLLADEAFFKRFDAMEEDKQKDRSRAETQAGLREMFKGDTSDFGKQVSKALEGDFDPEIMRPWLDSKIKAETARITKDELGKPELHDYNGQKVLTFGNSIIKLDNIDGKLRMQPKDLEQLKVRIRESASEIMSGIAYAQELDNLSKNKDAAHPIQDQLEALAKSAEDLENKYGSGTRVELITPDGKQKISVPKNQKEKALKGGYTLP